MSVLIKGGRVVTAADDYVADVFIEDEAVTLIGESLDVQADKVIDASGKMVLPGCIDPHTHLDMPFGGTTSADDFETGTIAATPAVVNAVVDALRPLGVDHIETMPLSPERVWKTIQAAKAGR